MVQTAVYMPLYLISTVVMVAILQILLSPSTGVVSGLLKSMHLIPPSINLRVPVLSCRSMFCPESGAVNWLEQYIIFIAARLPVDGQLYDAAKVDGANRWHDGNPWSCRRLSLPYCYFAD